MGETLETLKAYQLACALRKEAFRVSRCFPKDDLKGAEHMRETARQTTQSMAEGYHRNGYAEKIQFFRYSATSAEELLDQIGAAHDAGYIDEAERSARAAQCREVVRVTMGYLRYLRGQRDKSPPRGRTA
jgi:four helix bundle protein